MESESSMAKKPQKKHVDYILLRHCCSVKIHSHLFEFVNKLNAVNWDNGHLYLG